MPDATSTLAAPYSRFPTSQTIIGATSPLWSYFAGAALVGTAWWWMSRWSGLGAAAPASAARKRLATLRSPSVEAPAPTPAVIETPAPVPAAVEPPAPVEAATPAPPPLIQAPPLPTVEAAAEPPPAPKPRKPKDGEPKPH